MNFGSNVSPNVVIKPMEVNREIGKRETKHGFLVPHGNVWVELGNI